MKRLIVGLVAALLALWVVVAVWPDPKVGAATSVSSTQRPSPTTTTEPAPWPEGTLARDPDVRAALRFIGRYDPTRLRRMHAAAWDLLACTRSVCPTGVIGSTFAEYPCRTFLDLREVRHSAQDWRVEYLSLLAVTLAHEEVHCRGISNERVAVHAELRFIATLPAGSPRDALARVSREQLSLVCPDGSWEWEGGCGG